MHTPVVVHARYFHFGFVVSLDYLTAERLEAKCGVEGSTYGV
jgi:hypothetical protein